MVKLSKLMILKVEAPIKKRILRSGLDLQTFIERTNEYEVASTSSSDIEVVRTFFNNYDTVDQFRYELMQFNFADKELFRPGWDRYFMKLSTVVAKRSNCMKRAVGCVIVRDCRIVATGYNGTPFGMMNCN